MAGRNERYETKDQMEDLGNLSDRLAVDLRRVRAYDPKRRVIADLA